MLSLRRYGGRDLSGVLAVVLLLTSVGVASADCAWVLWLNRKERIAAFETLGTCMDEAKRNIMKVPPVPGHKPESSGSSWSVLAPLLVGGSSPLGYDCLPDTVDTLGPKAK
jgi:hypothetical protein